MTTRKYVVMTPIVTDGKVRPVGSRFNGDDDDPQVQRWRRAGVIRAVPPKRKQSQRDGDGE